MKHIARLCFVVLAITLLSTFASAGGWSSGGGDGVILKDDTVVLSDPYIQKHGEPAQLNELLVEELRRAGKFFVRYGAEMRQVQPDTDDHRDSKFFEDQILTDLVEFRFVDRLPPIAACSEHDKNGVPTEMRVEHIACTQGPVTWIRKDLFARMNIREQAKTIIHERLHSLSANVPHEFIADMTNAIELILSLYNDQQNDRFPVLTDEQVSLIRRFMRRLVQAGLTENRPRFYSRHQWENWRVSKNGGGLIKEDGTEIANDAYVGVGSLIGHGSKLREGAKVVFTACYELNFEVGGYGHLLRCDLHKNARLKNVTFVGRTTKAHDNNLNAILVLLKESAAIEDSFLHTPKSPMQTETGQVTLDTGARIVKSVLQYFEGIHLGAHALLYEFMVIAPQPDPLYFTKHLYPPTVFLHHGAELKNYRGINFMNSRRHPINPSDPPELHLAQSAVIDLMNEPLCRDKKDPSVHYPFVIEGETRVATREQLKHHCQK